VDFFVVVVVVVVVVVGGIEVKVQSVTFLGFDKCFHAGGWNGMLVQPGTGQ